MDRERPLSESIAGHVRRRIARCRRRPAATLLKAMSIAVTACLMVGGDLSYSESASARRNVPPPDAAAGGGPQTSNTAVRWLIQAQYRGDDIVSGGRISVQAENGIVTLTGVVGSEHARTRAVVLAERVRGVTTVQDRLQVERRRRAAE